MQFQSSRVSQFQDQFSRFKVPRFQGSRVSGPGCFHGTRVPTRFQKFQSSRGPGFQKFPRSTSFKVPGLGFQGFRVAGLQGSRVPAVQGFRVPGFQGSRVPGFQGSRVPRFQGCEASRVPRLPGFQAFGVPGFQRCGFQGSRVPGSRVPGFQGPRLPGSKVPGFRGLQGSRVPFRILKAASLRDPAPALEIETQHTLLLGFLRSKKNLQD